MARPINERPGDVRAWLTRSLCVSCVLSFAIGCRSPAPANRPIESWIPGIDAELNLASPGRSGKILLALTFSGGGTRAAAFSYGAMRELAATPVRLDGTSRPLTDEIDLISSVSGGSFTAAYFGLHGDRIFDDFEQAFLRRNVQRGLALEVLRPRYWLGFLGIDRSQLAARYYDRNVFHGATFADIQRRPGAPEIVINATDLSTVGRFPFMRYMFGQICSDLASYPVAEAVTASSAVPIVFPTVRLRNYAGTCGFEPPSWARGPAQDGNELRNMLREELVSHAEGGEGREFIHLLDGGLSDNLGLANSVAVFARISDPEQAFRRLGHEDLELILVVTVNAEGRDERSWDRLNRSASAVQVVSGLSNAQIKQNNRLTVKLARMALGGLARDLSTPERPVHFRHIELSFSKVANSEQRDFLSRIETSFNLSDKKVDRLIEAGRRVVRDSRELAEALALVDEVRDGPSGRSP